jgi:hypothetical protein
LSSQGTLHHHDRGRVDAQQFVQHPVLVIEHVGICLVGAFGRHQACHQHHYVGFLRRIPGLVQVGQIVRDGHLRHGRGRAEIPQHVLHAFQRRHGVQGEDLGRGAAAEAGLVDEL